MRVPIDLKQLTVAEKLDLLRELWESLPKSVSSPPLSSSIKKTLDERLLELKEDPSGGTPWARVRERVFATKRKTR